MIQTWLRYVLGGLVGLITIVVLLFCYVCWLSPTARLGKHYQQQSYLVRPGMSTEQALHIMGQPQKQRLLGEEVIYTYMAHPFASDDIHLIINRDGVVKTIGHGG
jgi:hypothetical protein